MIKPSVLVALVTVLIPRSAVAECITLAPYYQQRNAAVVFSGTAVNITANAASTWPSRTVAFDVDRVWKGPVTKQFVVYSFTRKPEPFIFSVGKKYLVFAHARTDEERHDLNLGTSESPQAFVIGQCGDGTRELAMVTPQEIAELGPASDPAR